MPAQQDQDQIGSNAPFQHLLNAVTRWVKRHRDRTELDRLERDAPAEFDRIAAELNMSPQDLHAVAALPSDAAQEVDALLTAVGIDAAAIAKSDPRVMRDLQRLCSQCRDKAQCRRDLDNCVAPETHRDYCLNAETIGALVRERGA